MKRFFHLALNDHLVPKMLRVTAIPLLSDNYCWRVANVVHKTAVLVDPSEGEPALQAHEKAFADDGCELVGILSTHYHGDHTGGNAYLADRLKGVPIIAGPEDGRVPGATRIVADGEHVELPGFSFKAIHTPCHTRGHICFYTADEVQLPAMLHDTAGAGAAAGSTSADQAQAGRAVPAVSAPGTYKGAVFTGDTLFSGGCGRFFEGTAPHMLSSLGKLSALPGHTLVYCGHEYTVSNLKFGLAVEPGNEDMKARMEACQQLVAQGRPTVPSTMAQELATNVFLRTARPEYSSLPTITANTDHGGPAQDEVEVMAALRKAKNNFKA